jgi:hypothetical protein
MLTRITVFVILVLSLATYASSPAGKTAKANSAVACCDGDPGTLP